MCTVTFIARQRGYSLGMNRDEKLTRPTGLPPKKRMVNGCAVLCPAEPGGGTWITLNEGGTCFALINWDSIAQRVDRNPVSRGEVVNSVSAIVLPDLAEVALGNLPLKQINPFRLIGIFPAAGEIGEWRWDLQRLVRKNHAWRTQQWISSGFDESTAQRIRSKVFQQAQRQKSVGSLDWLRRLHRSHAPQPGPFSTCMHRADAATVSYTEVLVSPREGLMRYHAGGPCHGSTCFCRHLHIGCLQGE
jgi:hypothetical protein